MAAPGRRIDFERMNAPELTPEPRPLAPLTPRACGQEAEPLAIYSMLSTHHSDSGIIVFVATDKGLCGVFFTPPYESFYPPPENSFCIPGRWKRSVSGRRARSMLSLVRNTFYPAHQTIRSTL
jgi:hypothetical protein